MTSSRTSTSHLRRERLRVVIAVTAALCSAVGAAWTAADDKPPPAGRPQWQDQAKVVLPKIDLPGLEVTPSQPVLIARSPGFLWFPTIARLANGDLIAKMQDTTDVHVQTSTCQAAWSSDGGLTWSTPVTALGGDEVVHLPSGDAVHLPFYLHLVSDGVVGNSYQVNARGRQVLESRPGLTVTGWPRKYGIDPPAAFRHSSFFFNGSTVALKNGLHLATLYGTFDGDRRYSLLAAESRDGVAWKIRSVIAGADCALPGANGPSEAATVRLKDGRLMSVFRMNDAVPLGQCWSDDEGKTWTAPVAMHGPLSVQPSMVRTPDGMLALSSGRPGLNVWLNPSGDGQSWHRVDLVANHNAALPAEKIGQTSGYTEIVALDDTHLLVTYDRLPSGWNAIPADSKETNSCWVVRLNVKRAAR